MAVDTASIKKRLAQAPTYHPGTAQALTDWSLQAGDIVTINSDGNSNDMPVYSFGLNWKGAPTVTLESTGNEKRDEVSKKTKTSRSNYGRTSANTETTESLSTKIEKDDSHIALIAQKLSNGTVTDWAKFDISADAITSKVSAQGVVSMINQTADTIKISAQHIELDGDTVAESLSACDLSVASIAAGSYTGQSMTLNGSITGGYVYGSEFVIKDMGDGFTLSDHSHSVTVSADGTVTLGEPSETGGSFKIADTKAYVNLVSALMQNFGTEFTYLRSSNEYKIVIDTTFNTGDTATGTYYMNAPYVSNVPTRYIDSTSLYWNEDDSKYHADLKLAVSLNNGYMSSTLSYDVDVDWIWQKGYLAAGGGKIYTASKFTDDGTQITLDNPGSWTADTTNGTLTKTLYTASKASARTSFGSTGGKIEVYVDTSGSGNYHLTNTYTFSGTTYIYTRSKADLYTTNDYPFVYTPSKYE